MTSESISPVRITSATLSSDDDGLHALYEAGIARARASLGHYHRNLIGGAWRDGGDGTFETRSPIDREIVMGTFAKGSREDVRAAVGAARAAQPAWGATPWPERLAVIRRAAKLMSERLMEFSALQAMELGKNRLEALGEVEETADLFRYYADTMEDNAGYDRPLGNLGDSSVHTRTVLRPFGVFAIVSPFPFPFALAGGPMTAAIMAGNTVVFKPSSRCPLSSIRLTELFRNAGLPAGVLNLVMGPGMTVGKELQNSPAIDGIAFTGSYEVGHVLFKVFSPRYPRPCILEMGGKNPAIVTRSADLEEAAEGIIRSAFGFGGQKCSSNSRVYVERPVHDDLVRLMVEKTEKLTIGDPMRRQNWLGPVIDARAVARYEKVVAEARLDGRVLVGGQRLTNGGLGRGYYVEPVIVDHLPTDHRLFKDELFLPFTAVATVDSLEQAIRLSNESLYGLTAGVFSVDPAEVQQFLAEMHAGVLYVNRRAGATSGASPGIQSFGGWKGSSSSGWNALGQYYVAQYMREQSHTIVD